MLFIIFNSICEWKPGSGVSLEQERSIVIVGISLDYLNICASVT
jgi:hypothetical protein